MTNSDADLSDLLFRKLESEQFHSRFVTVGGAANDSNKLIEIGQRDQIALERFGALFCFAQFEACAPQHDFAAVLDVAGVRFFKRKQFWPSMVDRQHDDRE